MYNSPLLRKRAGGANSFFIKTQDPKQKNTRCIYLNMLSYYNAINAYDDLRWLLRRGSPLPIPNRAVKPDSADGTTKVGE